MMQRNTRTKRCRRKPRLLDRPFGPKKGLGLLSASVLAFGGVACSASTLEVGIAESRETRASLVSGDELLLDGANLFSTASSFFWEQLEGPSIDIADPMSPQLLIVAPVVSRTAVIKLSLTTVTEDARATVIYEITVEPRASSDCGLIEPQAVSISGTSGAVASHLTDHDLSTRWSERGDGTWATLDFGSMHSLGSLDIAFYRGDRRTAYFDIQVSDDGASWLTVLSNQSSRSDTTDAQAFSIEDQARYVRYIGRGNSENDWNSLTELWVRGCPAKSSPPPAPSCDDGTQNGDETGADCGGSCPNACPATPSCDDGAQNGDETGTDCGGSCPACPTSRPGEMLMSRSELLSLPMSGTAWNRMKADADANWGPVDLSDQDNRTGVYVLAAALVYARTSDPAYRAKAITALEKVPSSPTGRVLSMGRQLAGYVLAADLVNYRSSAFVSWVADVRTRYLGNHGRWVNVTQTAEDTANNWGTWAAVSRVAASIYVGDQADVDRAALLFRRWLGDTSVNHEFARTADFDEGWVCWETGNRWSPVNPAHCGPAKDGAFIEDISRGPAFPDASGSGVSYSIEVMQAAVLEAILLQRAGYGNLWAAEDHALRRAADFLDRAGGWPGRYTVEHHVAYVLNHVYGTNYPTASSSGRGRSLGYTDWLFISNP